MRKLTLKEILESERSLVLEIPTPKEEYDPILRKFILDCFNQEFRAKDSIEEDDIRFAAGEMVANAIYYGNNYDSSKKIRLACSWIDDCFYFVVGDEGNGFDIENPEYKGMPVPMGSLGIAYTKQRMDLVYNFGDSAAYCVKRIQSKNQ